MSRRNQQVAPVHQVDFALTVVEYNCIVAAAKAMNTPLSLLFTTAALEAAHALGYYEGFLLPHRAPPGTWNNLPPREPPEVATKRIAINVPSLNHQTIKRAAEGQLGIGWPEPVQTFMIGSTLRFIATLLFRVQAALQDTSASPEDRAAFTALLANFDACFQEVSQRAQVRFEVPGSYFMK